MTGTFNWIGQQPHRALWISLPFILLVGWLNRYSRIDIQIHDTYFVTTAFFIAILAFVYLGIVSGLYYACRNISLATWMNIAHVVGSIFIVVMLILYHIGEDALWLSFDWTYEGSMNHNPTNGIPQRIVVGVMIFLFVQLVFILNMTFAIFKNITLK